jgi:spiro-SPASM protein
MKNTTVINAIGLGERALRPLINGESSLSRAISFGRALPGVEDVVLLLSKPLPGISASKSVLHESWTLGSLLAALEEKGRGSQDIFYFFGDCPLLDPEVSARMHANHVKYFADYTFADGYPYGLTPEILRWDMVEKLIALHEGTASQGGTVHENPASRREALFELISRDINSFDVETELAPVDQRMLRVSLTADTERNWLLLTRLVEKGGKDASSASRVLEEYPGIRRTLPAFFPVQIVERCPQACTYCPYPIFGGDVLSGKEEMSVESFLKIVENIAGFSRDAVIDISLWGEPGLHSRIFEIVKAALSRHEIDLVIETSGVGWNPETLERISREFSRSPTWILSLDAQDEGMYGKLRGKGYAESRKTAARLFELFPRTTYVQAVRMKENEDDLEVFFKFWREKTENVIVQKHDFFCGFLPEKKIADLSPLKRFPCWHVLRDMPILMDGRVPLCREDVKGSHVLGNALSSGLEEIWERGEELHARHIARDYPGMCASCDEWYTYNF